MRLFKGQAKKLSMTLAILLAVSSLSGCGQEPVEELQEISDEAENSEDKEDVDSADSTETADKKTEEESGQEPETDSEAELSGLQYIELTTLSKYDVYAPKEHKKESGHITYYDHGLTFAAEPVTRSSTASAEDYLEETVGYIVASKQESHRDVTVSELMENGSDRYQIISCIWENSDGTPIEVNTIYYLDIQDKGSGVMWHAELFEMNVDEETNLIIDELAECYQVDLEEFKVGGEWLAAHAPKTLSDTILWFNATYAPLTYSNSCDWKIVGGMDASDYNRDFDKAALSRSWNIDDRESALDTVERLIEDGHRAKCRECMEELDEMGLLKVDEDTFVQGLLDSGIEDNLFRYVIAYSLYQDGEDAEYIAAWDLCRANQLYADFYICGYMTYEEAMDASLENSLKLQKMYSSWEEMIDSYMLGYQFWQNDPCTSDYSPTMRRYQCYEELLEMEDGPYTLDWDMKLEKSW